jgi:hypothetical protein
MPPSSTGVGEAIAAAEKRAKTVARTWKYFIVVVVGSGCAECERLVGAALLIEKQYLYSIHSPALRGRPRKIKCSKAPARPNVDSCLRASVRVHCFDQNLRRSIIRYENC